HLWADITIESFDFSKIVRKKWESLTPSTNLKTIVSNPQLMKTLSHESIAAQVASIRGIFLYLLLRKQELKTTRAIDEAIIAENPLFYKICRKAFYHRVTIG